MLGRAPSRKTAPCLAGVADCQMSLYRTRVNTRANGVWFRPCVSQPWVVLQVTAAECPCLAGCICQCGSASKGSLQPADKATPGGHLGRVHRRLEPEDQPMPSHSE